MPAVGEMLSFDTLGICVVSQQVLLHLTHPQSNAAKAEKVFSDLIDREPPGTNLRSSTLIESLFNRAFSSSYEKELSPFLLDSFAKQHISGDPIER